MADTLGHRATVRVRRRHRLGDRFWAIAFVALILCTDYLLLRGVLG